MEGGRESFENKKTRFPEIVKKNNFPENKKPEKTVCQKLKKKFDFSKKKLVIFRKSLF